MGDFCFLKYDPCREELAVFAKSKRVEVSASMAVNSIFLGKPTSSFLSSLLNKADGRVRYVFNVAMVTV